MIHFNELIEGSYVICSDDGDPRRGKVTRLNNDEKQVGVDNGTQEFFYELDQLSGIPLNDAELQSLKFQSEKREDGNIKYSKGAFRILIPAQDNFSKMEIWYRDETRQILHHLMVHELQKHYSEMTKIHLDDSSFN